MHDDIRALMDAYNERFGDVFPRMCCMDWDDARVCGEIERCLETGRAFDPYEGMSEEEAKHVKF